MSTILKALRRLEDDKRTRSGRSLREDVTQPGSAGPGRAAWRALVFVAVLSLALGVGATTAYWWLGPNDLPVLPAVAASPRPAPPALRPPPPAPSAAPQEAPAFDRAPARAVPAPEIAEPDVALIERVPAEPPRFAPRLPADELPNPPLAPRRASPAPAVARAPDPVDDLRSESAIVPPRAPVPVIRRAAVPAVVVTRTVWHPNPERRLAVVTIEGRSTPLELREGDAASGLVVLEIEPSGVLFRHGDVEIQRGVGVR
ncbi:MAG: hypothetical protein MJE66_15740 [Proteobacteria bacterium]|nr:hypothetical protein [Pseudomonadota bacterium]